MADSYISYHERRLIEACGIANEDPELNEVEREFDALSDVLGEPWTRDDKSPHDCKFGTF